MSLNQDHRIGQTLLHYRIIGAIGGLIMNPNNRAPTALQNAMERKK